MRHISRLPITGSVLDWLKAIALIVLTASLYFEALFLFSFLFVNIITKSEGANDVFVSNFGWLFGIAIIWGAIIIGKKTAEVETIKKKAYIFAFIAFLLSMFISLPITIILFSFQIRFPRNILMNLVFGSYRQFLIYTDVF